MRVVFTKGPGIGYEIAVHREIGPELAPRNGPGGHPYLPHDLVHLLVDETAQVLGLQPVHGAADVVERPL